MVVSLLVLICTSYLLAIRYYSPQTGTFLCETAACWGEKAECSYSGRKYTSSPDM